MRRKVPKWDYQFRLDPVEDAETYTVAAADLFWFVWSRDLDMAWR